MIRRKDGGYAWVVLASSFMSHFVHIGFTFAVLGTITKEHSTKFGISQQESNWITSVHTGMLFLFAPLSSVMVKKLSCRTTEICGGIAMMLGVGLSALSMEAWHAYILFSVIAAWGVSATYMASSEILGHYFERHKYLAFAVAVLGYYCGMVVWPSVSQSLFHSMGYSIAMAIMGGFHAIHVVAGILFFEPTKLTESKDVNETTASPNHEQEQFIHKEQPDSSDSSDHMKTINFSSEKHKNGPEETSGLGNDLLVLVKSIKVWALLLNSFLWEFNVSSFFTLVNRFAISPKGPMKLTDAEAALGITILGIMNIVACILVMATSRLKYDRIILHCCTTAVFGSMTIAITLCDSTESYYAVAAIWGLAQGAEIANLLAVVSEFCGVQHLALLFGILMLCEAPGAMFATPICGFVQETFGEAAGFYLSGSAGLLSSLVILPVIIMNAIAARRLVQEGTPRHEQSHLTTHVE